MTVISVNGDAPAAAATVDVTPPRTGPTSYVQILKSTSLIGGSSVVNIAFGIVRSKAIALLLGPSGVGMFGLYNSILEVAQSVASLGIQSSGVRQIAEAVGSGDSQRIARTAIVLKRVSIGLGLAGAALLAAGAAPLSTLTFGDPSHAPGVVLLSLALFFRLVSAGQTALIQGMRRIRDLAAMTVIAAISGTAISIPFVYWLGERGIVPSLVVVGAASLATSWWFSRRVVTSSVSVRASDVWDETSSLVKLGLAFMASGFLTMGASYAVRIIVLRQGGVDAAGLYQAAWALGGLYVAFILQAMGADFYPRLTGVAQDDAACNRLVNEQAEISLLLAGPGVIATLTYAPVILSVFYSSQFQDAVTLLRWICLGMMLRVVAWPMGFIVLAKGARQAFLWTEVAAAVVNVGLAWLLVPRIGVNGAGVAFFGLYLWHSLLIYFVVRQMSQFRWAPSTRVVGGCFLPITGAVFASFFVLPFWLATTTGTATAVFAAWYSARRLMQLVPLEALPSYARRCVMYLAKYNVKRDGHV